MMLDMAPHGIDKRHRLFPAVSGRCYALLYTPSRSHSGWDPAADVDHDSHITSLDALMILQAAAETQT